MEEFYEDEADDLHLANSAVAVKQLVARQRKKTTVQSVVTALLVFLALLGILGVVALIPLESEIPDLIAYSVPPELDNEEVTISKVAHHARPQPPGSSASMARVIASSSPAAVTVPIPDSPVPDALFGMEDAIGTGFGTGDGDGGGGGGVTFFGSHRKGKSVVFVVDFSGSMKQSVATGGTRIEALKKEMKRSIKKITPGMNVSIVFFSTTGWTIETKGDPVYQEGWNGLNETPELPWYPATVRSKQALTSEIDRMSIGGGTNWYPALKMALLGTNPAPSIVYLLSDGDPRDFETVMEEMNEINPQGIPIDTIGFEQPGTAAGKLREIASFTGGKFSMVYKGKLRRGSSAEKLTSPTYDER